MDKHENLFGNLNRSFVLVRLVIVVIINSNNSNNLIPFVVKGAPYSGYHLHCRKNVVQMGPNEFRLNSG